MLLVNIWRNLGLWVFFFFVLSPILGYSSKLSNIYKETEDLAKVTYAKFEDRKEFLHHPFIKIFIFEKWEKIKYFFIIFRLIHVSVNLLAAF